MVPKQMPLRLILAAGVAAAVVALVAVGMFSAREMARSRAAAHARSRYLEVALDRRKTFESSSQQSGSVLQRTTAPFPSPDSTATYEREDHRRVSARRITIGDAVDRLLAEADFTEADLSEATLSGGRKAFQATIFSRANLNGAKLSGDSAFQKADFRRANLTRAVLQGGTASFQLATFRDAALQYATLAGEESAFQLADFSGARLNAATVIGGASSLQYALFEGADLTRAQLAVSGSGLQYASFDGANLSHAVIRCNGSTGFQLASIKNANFCDADLSTVEDSALASCVFPLENPPTYNKGTRFPAAFDPAAHRWRYAPDGSNQARFEPAE